MPRIRAATATDIPVIVALNAYVQDWHVQTYPERFIADPDPAALSAWLDDRLAAEGVVVFLSFDQRDRPLGYLWAQVVDRPANPLQPARKRLIIEHIAVAESARRDGHARALCDAAAAHAREAGCDDLFADTWAGNWAAQASFRALGFQLEREWFSRAATEPAMLAQAVPLAQAAPEPAPNPSAPTKPGTSA